MACLAASRERYQEATGRAAPHPGPPDSTTARSSTLSGRFRSISTPWLSFRPASARASLDRQRLPGRSSGLRCMGVPGSLVHMHSDIPWAGADKAPFAGLPRGLVAAGRCGSGRQLWMVYKVADRADALTPHYVCKARHNWAASGSWNSGAAAPRALVPRPNNERGDAVALGSHALAHSLRSCSGEASKGA